MTPTPQIHLTFNGNCDAAFRFYEERLGATRGLMFPYGNSPMAEAVPSGWETKIMHGSITLGGITVAGADVASGYEQPRGFRIFLEADDPADTERLFHALAENATIEMALQETRLESPVRPADGSIRDSVGPQLRSGAQAVDVSHGERRPEGLRLHASAAATSARPFTVCSLRWRRRAGRRHTPAGTTPRR